ncbi:hypothetical protein IQ247_13835 [Plectonema cf. radiosum LEGE 06105]|uniref:Uncharacterized protein n=1 Tax=Plectonema cf. radiosum LEGE 06105 TaxID=945769 RepID=A0A8J7F0T1_9CYAN|nr:hypothetical protein [Plectonema radiosum]MBE9213733.1 hypothetical protein [Plectonema cf. radiosum LEGE 06105]
MIHKLSIETIQDFIEAANDKNLYLALRDNLGRRYLKPTTKQYLNEILEKSLDLVLHKEVRGEYTLICYWTNDDCNFDPVTFLIEKEGIEKIAVKAI